MSGFGLVGIDLVHNLLDLGVGEDFADVRGGGDFASESGRKSFKVVVL